MQRIHAETVKALALPDVKERLVAAALQPVGNTPQQFAVVIRSEIERWGKLAREIGHTTAVNQCLIFNFECSMRTTFRVSFNILATYLSHTNDGGRRWVL